MASEFIKAVRIGSYIAVNFDITTYIYDVFCIIPSCCGAAVES